MDILCDFKDEMKSRKNKIVFLIVSVIGGFLFYSYIYGDILTTARMGISLWDNLFSGSIRSYYRDTFQLTTLGYEQQVWATYDFPIYVIFSIWNFPLWVIEHFGKIDVLNNVLCLMWIKTMLIPFIFYFLKALYRVCVIGNYDRNRAVLVCIMFITSGFFFSAILIDGQYDIIEMCFIMLGIEAYLKNDMKKFCLWFTIAIPLKLFALLLFVPLLLLREKRILRIIGYTIIPFLVLALFRILIPTASDNVDENGEMMSHFPFEYTAHLGLEKIYIFFMLLGIILLACWFVKLSQENEFKVIMYLCFIVYFVEFTTMLATPYWLLMMVPFLCLITLSDNKYFLVNSILELLMTAGLFFAQMFHFYWCFNSNVSRNMLLSIISGRKNALSSLSLISLLERYVSPESVQKISEHAIGIGSSVFVGCGLIFAIINCPIWKRTFPVIEFQSGKQVKLYFFLRILLSLVIGVIPLALYILA